MANKGMAWYYWLATILVLVGGLNWGLVGFFGFNLVEAIFGTGMFTKIIYDIVGISTVVSIIGLMRK